MHVYQSFLRIVVSDQILRLCDIPNFLPSRYMSRCAKNIMIHESIHDTQRCQKYHDTWVDARCTKVLKVSWYMSQYTIHANKENPTKIAEVCLSSDPGILVSDIGGEEERWEMVTRLISLKYDDWCLIVVNWNQYLDQMINIPQGYWSGSGLVWYCQTCY